MTKGGQYFSVEVDAPEASSELLQDALHGLSSLGLEVRDREAPPMPGVRGPADGEVIVIAFFETRPEAEAALTEVQARFDGARAELREVVSQDWSESWKSLIRTVEVGRLWVGPPWEAPNAPPEKIRIIVEPKMAFGTGDHPTTSLCLAAVSDHLASHPGASVLDVGTGTGVLAIAARKLGASKVVGVDNDPTSVDIARENAAVNGVSDIELSGRTLAQIEGSFDLVLANILANTLVELAPAIAQKVRGRLVLAGVLAHQEEEVAAAYTNLGLRRGPTARQGEWVRLELSRG